jgi:hypothetical protein
MMDSLPTGTITFLFTDLEGQYAAVGGASRGHAPCDRPPRSAPAPGDRESRGERLQDQRRRLLRGFPAGAGGARRRSGSPARARRRRMGRAGPSAGPHGASHRNRRGAGGRLLRSGPEPRRPAARDRPRGPNPPLADGLRPGARQPPGRSRAAGPGPAPSQGPAAAGAGLSAAAPGAVGRLRAAPLAGVPAQQPAAPADELHRQGARDQRAAALAVGHAAAHAHGGGRQRQDPSGPAARR